MLLLCRCYCLFVKEQHVVSEVILYSFGTHDQQIGSESIRVGDTRYDVHSVFVEFSLSFDCNSRVKTKPYW